MFNNLTSFLKLILVILSAILSYSKFKENNRDLGYYWIIVMLYWFFNFLSGLNFK